jgi:hypothetical protein
MWQAASKKQDAAVCEAMRAAASCFAVPPDKRGTPIEAGIHRVPTGVAYGWCHSAWMRFPDAGGGTSSKAFGSRMCAPDPPFTPPGGGPPLKRRKPRLPPSRQHHHLRCFIHSPQTEIHGMEYGIDAENGQISASRAADPSQGIHWSELSTIRPPLDFAVLCVDFLLVGGRFSVK